MAKWFEDKFERDNLRKYTKKRLDPGFFDNFSRRFSMTNWIIIFNFLIFIIVLSLVQIFGEDKIISLLALQANSFFSGKYWTPLTSMFIHIELWHLLANMVSLFFIGNFVEKLIGRKRFFWLYVLSGIFAGLFYVILSNYLGVTDLGAKIFGNPAIYAVGASGAVFSLLGLLAILTPYNKVYLIAGPLIAIILQSIFSGIFPNSSFTPVLNLIVYAYVIISVLSIFSFNRKIIRIALPIEMPFWILPIVAIIPLVIVGLFFPLPIGNSAHFGGLIAGLIYAFYLKNKYRKKTEMIKKYFTN